MSLHITHHILMVRPFRFRKNEQTAVNNYYQHDIEEASAIEISKQAIWEFDQFVNLLKLHGVAVTLIEGGSDFDTPDRLFPNNVISFHPQKMVLYPMFAPNRRRERNLITSSLSPQLLKERECIDYTVFEEEQLFLEGTGCLILDRDHKKAYCSLSPRASAELIHKFCLDFSFQPVIFQALQAVGEWRKSIYHTNVMLSIGQHFAVICLDAIDNREHRKLVVDSLNEDHKTIITITEDQVAHFAGNILELKSINQEPLIVMSSQAYRAFLPQQLAQLSQFGTIIHSPLDTIETCGGGSARCMIAEIF